VQQHVHAAHQVPHTVCLWRTRAHLLLLLLLLLLLTVCLWCTGARTPLLLVYRCTMVVVECAACEVQRHQAGRKSLAETIHATS